MWIDEDATLIEVSQRHKHAILSEQGKQALTTCSCSPQKCSCGITRLWPKCLVTTTSPWCVLQHTKGWFELTEQRNDSILLQSEWIHEEHTDASSLQRAEDVPVSPRHAALTAADRPRLSSAPGIGTRRQSLTSPKLHLPILESVLHVLLSPA